MPPTLVCKGRYPSGAVPDGPLASPVAAAGVNLARRTAYVKVQHALTTQREKVLVARLEADLDALADARDPRRASYLCADRLSTAWVTTWPTTALSLSNFDFLEVAANFMGLRSEERRVGKECRSRWSPYH